jgi:hypothetical protein
LRRSAVESCRADISRLRLEVRVEDARGKTVSPWVSADTVTGCDEFDDWRTATVPLPAELNTGNAGAIRMRVREAGPSTAPAVYLRHVTFM